MDELDITRVGNLRLIYRPKTNDKIIINEILNDDIYRLRSMRTDKNVNILDIGSHIGIFSLASRLTFPKANIVGYELDEENYMLSLVNNGLNSENIRFFNKAVVPPKPSDILPSGRIKHAVRNRGSFALLYGDTVDDSLDIEYFDSLLDKYYYILKMDIEGGEFPILENIDVETLANHIGYFIIEFHNDFVKKTGYKPKKFKSSRQVVKEISKYFDILQCILYSPVLQIYVFKNKHLG